MTPPTPAAVRAYDALNRMQSIMMMADGTHPRNILRDYIDAAELSAETAETRYTASQDALTECMGELREARERVAELEECLNEEQKDNCDLEDRVSYLEAENADLCNAGGPPFIRSEAIRNLKADLAAEKQETATLRAYIAQDHAIVEMLEAQNARLREALTPFAAMEEQVSDWPAGAGVEVEECILEGHESFCVEDVRNAAKALAETAEAELKEWRMLRAWGGTPEIVEQWIKGQQVRIHHAQGVEEELAKAEACVKELEEHLKGTMRAGGYEHFVERLRLAERRTHNATYVAEQAQKKVAELEAALEMGQRNCDDVYNDLREERDRARAQNARLREALDFLLIGYEGLGGDMENNAPAMAKAALADTKSTP